MGGVRDSRMWCTYCGKQFTRKEHLERHIPSHTNVKPYRCEDCGLAFTRRDLLVRHHATYHAARDDTMGPAPGGAPSNTGRTQIACQPCAQAKTGCDKGIPCSRCRDKGLECLVRYARRSTKNVYRAAQAAQTSRRPSVTMPAQHPPSASPSMLATPMGTPFVPPSIDVSQGVSRSDHQVKPLIASPSAHMTIDPRMSQHDNVLYGSPPQARPDVPFSPLIISAVDDAPFSAYGNDFLYQGLAPPDVWEFNEYAMYASNQPFTHTDGLMMPEFSPMASTSSDPVESTLGSTHTRSTSIVSSKEADQVLFRPDSPLGRPAIETGALITSESAWPIARCNPVIFSGNCPKTAIIYLESLENKSKQESTWTALEGFLDIAAAGGTDFTSVVPLHPRSRDLILAITQVFLQKALNIHRRSFQPLDGQHRDTGGLPYLVLPPNKILEYFLRSYVRNLSCLFPLVPSGHVNPNEMIASSQAANLLFLLMIAQGASVVSSEEARTLSAGLIETCRISLFDIIEKNVEMCADSTIHRCSLLFTLLGAWSGDKWLMDIAMGQRGMYISMLKHAGMFESMTDPSSTDLTNIEAAWRSWLDQETKNRLVYNWVMVDQELSLFHDTAPMIAVTDLCTPLPGPEQLWMSGDANQWMAAMQPNINCPPANTSAQLLSPPSLTPSLFALFRDFLHNSPENQKWGALTPHRLRLLLHPLQSLLWNLRELKCYLSNTQKASKSIEEASPLKNLADTQSLLQRWYKLSRQYFQANPTCVVSKTNLVLFHLISLNAVTNFPAIERLARREGLTSSETLWEFPAQHGPYIHNIEETVYHCGQVVSLVRAIPGDLRPIWWSAAIYRALLILWAYSVLRGDASFLQNEETGIPLVIDKVAVEDEALYNYMWKDGPKAVPVLSGPKNSTVSLLDSSKVVDYAVKMLEEGVSTRFSDGIKRKLIALGKAWKNVQTPLIDQILSI